MKNNLMKKTKLIFVGILIALISVSATDAQRRRSRVKPKVKPQPIIFAVVNDGQMIEPLGLVDKGNLEAATGGDGDEKDLAAFAKSYYQPKTTYQLVFGGADAGTVTVTGSNAKADCNKNMAQITVQSKKTKLKGFVMALATSDLADKSITGVRRLPTAAERAEIETLVRAEFVKQSVTASAAKNLKYHNLTALDVDNDKRAEMVGTFWVETAPTTRALLFFIADKNANGKYAIGLSEFKTIKQDELMSGADIKTVDEGIYHERLLDALEYDGDTSAEIFTYTQSFEGSSFSAYSRREGKWEKAFEGSNYHCAY